MDEDWRIAFGIFLCARRYAMALARGYVMARYRLALVVIKIVKSFVNF